MKYSFTFIFSTVLLLAGQSACNHRPSGHKAHQGQEIKAERTEIRLTAENVEASGPYLTYDHQGKPVLCWTEKLAGQEEIFVLKYAVFNPAAGTFGDPIEVLPSRGTRAHPESMNKVGFKADGTVVAVFAVKHPTEENPFAGSIYYTLSSDGGKSWSDAAFLHSDTLPHYGRGYFDLATLADGELGAVWLDGRFAEADTGSALFFSRTLKGKGFGKDQQIGESTCECCRTDLLAGQDGRIYVAYRDISFPASQMGKQVRDISYSFSDDGGKTFSRAKSISMDNWAIEGCPHTGPSLATDGQGLHAVWFSAGGGPGVYSTSFVNEGESFGPRVEVCKEGRYPQITSLQNGGRLIVWEEASGTNEAQATAVSGQHQHATKHGQTSTASKIILRLEGKNQGVKLLPVSGAGEGSPTHPVVASINQQKVLIAWTQEGKEGSAIIYKIVGLP